MNKYIDNMINDIKKDINLEEFENDFKSNNYKYRIIDNKDLIIILSFLDFRIKRLYESMIDRQRRDLHYLADDSRELIYIIDKIDELIYLSDKENYGLELTEYFNQKINENRKFLKSSGGSEIPKEFKLDINKIKYEKLFLIKDQIITGFNKKYEKKLIGEGSYAHVHKYYDEYYKEWFATKTAKENLEDKEIIRFKREYEVMRHLCSPYIIKVYNYDGNKISYTMEYADTNLRDYIKKNNNKMLMKKRHSLKNQLLKAFEYLDFKNIRHRDLYPKNILIKNYEDVSIIKLCDFGLVKLEDSTLTSLDTDIKGGYRDPLLEYKGFKNYSIRNEIYSLTKVIYFIMTGKERIDNEGNEDYIRFYNKNTSINIDERSQTLKEFINEVNSVFF